jgi:hypothetical protein
LQSITNYIITLDKMGHLGTSNHSLAPLFGVSDDEMMTSSYRSWMGGVGGDTNNTLKKDFNRVFEIGEQITKKNGVINVASRGGTLTVGHNIMPLWAETGEKKRYSRRKSTPLNSTSRTGGLDSNVKEDMNGLGASISDRSAPDCTSSLAGDLEPSSSPKAHMGRRILGNTVLYKLSDLISTAAAPKDTNVDPNIARDELLKEQLTPLDDEYCRAVRLILVEKGKRFKCGMNNDSYHAVRQDGHRHNFFPK